MNILDACCKILEEIGTPLHYKELTRRILASGLWVSGGKTPADTVSARLSEHIKRFGDRSRIIRTGKGTYAIRSQEKTSDCQGETGEAQRAQPPAAQPGCTFAQCARRILEEGGGAAMHVRAITEQALARGWLKSRGESPVASMFAALSAANKGAVKRGQKPPFLLPGKGMAALNSDDDSHPAPEDTNALTFPDCAERVLEASGSRTPMHYRDITREALEQGWLKTRGKTPAASMYAQIITDIRRSRLRGEQPRFVQLGRGMIALSKWNGEGVILQINQHNMQVRKALRARLAAMDGEEFEQLIAILLMEMGFEEVAQTRYTRDGGIDVRGILTIAESIRIKLAVQAKHWKHNVQAQVVQQVRGSRGVHEQGLIITTSDFSKGARNEASQPDKTPIALINGEQLVRLLMDYGIGVTIREQRVFELDPESLPGPAPDAGEAEG